MRVSDPLMQRPSEQETSVVYGVYDSSQQAFSVRVRDFFIDRQNVKIQEKSYFFHLLGVMLDAGIPIMQSLKVLSKKTNNPRFARIINTLAYDVEHGRSLSRSMTKFPDVFKEAEAGVVRSGEAIGDLEQLLFRMAEQTERAHELYLKVRGALIYPATVLAALLVSGAVVVTLVIPKLEEFFLQADVEMPFLTNLVLDTGRFLINFSWLVVMAVIFMVVLVSIYVNGERGRRKWDQLLLSLPWVGNIVRRLNVARFVQVLSLLVEAGVPIHEAIKISSGAMNNVLYKEFLLSLKKEVERGERIAQNLAEAPFLFPETVVAMVSVGENTGNIGLVADKLAKHYEREVEHALDDFTALLEPIVIILVGLAVGVLTVSLLGPIFSLSSLVV